MSSISSIRVFPVNVWVVSRPTTSLQWSQSMQSVSYKLCRFASSSIIITLNVPNWLTEDFSSDNSPPEWTVQDYSIAPILDSFRIFPSKCAPAFGRRVVPSPLWLLVTSVIGLLNYGMKRPILWKDPDGAFRRQRVFVEDILTASSETLNLFEQKQFRHRALIHAPIYQDGQLFGIIEPCILRDTQGMDWWDGLSLLTQDKSNL